MNKIIITLCTILFVGFLQIQYTKSISCTQNFCKGYRCPVISECENGYIKKNGSYCACCDACITYLDEGQSCLMEFLHGVPPTTECRPGLYCAETSIFLQFLHSILFNEFFISINCMMKFILIKGQERTDKA
uniref:IGFBP N-terminal domain-containing protein n=1 Tax=Strigamia maritima TaxID=126957 RepID=T1JF69_STRMM